MTTDSRNPFTQPAVLVPVDDAIAYADSILAGVDVLLIELAENLSHDIPSSIPTTERAKIIAAIRDRVEAAREAISEENPMLPHASPPSGLAHMS